MDLQELSDRQEISDLITRFVLAVDTFSFADLRLVFTDDAVLDYSGAGGPTGSADVVVPWIEQTLGKFDRFQHLIGQLAVDLQGDSAQVTAYFTSSRVVRVEPEGTETVREVGGYHHHDLVRTPDGWRCRAFVDNRVWSRRG